MEQPAIMDVGAISTHSLTRRLTTFTGISFRILYYFNSQPHKEADRDTIKQYVEANNFNSQPHKEADTGQNV